MGDCVFGLLKVRRHKALFVFEERMRNEWLCSEGFRDGVVVPQRPGVQCLRRWRTDPTFLVNCLVNFLVNFSKGIVHQLLEPVHFGAAEQELGAL